MQWNLGETLHIFDSQKTIVCCTNIPHDNKCTKVLRSRVANAKCCIIYYIPLPPNKYSIPSQFTLLQLCTPMLAEEHPSPNIVSRYCRLRIAFPGLGKRDGLQDWVLQSRTPLAQSAKDYIAIFPSISGCMRRILVLLRQCSYFLLCASPINGSPSATVYQ